VGNAAICFTTAFSETSFLWRVTGLSALGLVMLNAIVCGQRLAFALVPITIAILMVLTGQIANLKRFIPIGIGLALVMTIGLSFLNPAFVQQRFDSFVSRWNSSSPVVFLQKQFTDATDGPTRIFGKGLGAGTNSTRVFGPVALLETFHPKIVFEMGYIGLAAFMLFVTHLTILAFRDTRAVRDRYLRTVGSSFWVFLLIIGYFPYWYPLDTDPVAVYYWFMAGLIFRLPSLEKQEMKVAIADSPSPSPKQGLKLRHKHLSSA
jgi:cell division protein FtsW (lipid II flippase)